MAGIIVGTAAVGTLIGGPAPSSQVSAQVETVSIGSLSLLVGEQGSVELEALNIGAPGLRSWSIDIVYDPAVVSVMECSPLEGVCSAAFANDTIRLVGSSNTGLEGNTVLAAITFRCAGEGTSALTVVIQNLADATPGDLQPIDAATENGSIDCSGLTPTPCPPESCPTPTVSIGSLSLNVGEDGSVELKALNIGPPGLGAWTIDLTYDPFVVSILACTPKLGVCNPWFGEDTIRVTGGSSPDTAPEGDITLANIAFHCDNAGSGALTLSLHVFADALRGDPQDIDAATENGSITCNSLTPTSTPTPTPTPLRLLGDVDGDRTVGSLDALFVLWLAAGLIPFVPYPDAADVNLDGVIGPFDAALILQLEAGLIDSLAP